MKKGLTIRSKILDGVLDFRMFQKRARKTPFIFQLRKNNLHIAYVGVKHSKNPHGPQAHFIENALKRFVEKKNDRKVVIAVENFIPPLSNSKREMIRCYRESGLVTYLARVHGVDVFCPEPLWSDTLAYILRSSKFDKKDIALWMFLNALLALSSRKDMKRKHLIKQLRGVVVHIARELKLKQSSSDQYFLQLHGRLRELTREQVLPERLDKFAEWKLNVAQLRRMQDPFIKKTVINDIGAAFNRARDRFLVFGILQKLIDGKSVFTVFGDNHVIAHEPVLKAFFAKK